jgi:hypothetical protein
MGSENLSHNAFGKGTTSGVTPKCRINLGL